MNINHLRTALSNESFSNNWDFVDDVHEQEPVYKSSQTSSPFVYVPGTSGKVDIKISESLQEKFGEFKAQYRPRCWFPASRACTWKYYQVCPFNTDSVVIIRGLYGNECAFFKQLNEMEKLKIHTSAVSFDGYSSADNWIADFKAFLNHLHIVVCHIVAIDSALRLVIPFINKNPEIVKSLAICLSAEELVIPSTTMTRVLPIFQMSRMILPDVLGNMIGKGTIDMYLGGIPQIPIDDIVSQNAEEFIQFITDDICSDTLVTRIRIHGLLRQSEISHISCSVISLIVSIDDSQHESVKNMLAKNPTIKVFPLRSHSRFPYLADADEFNLYLRLHLRSMGMDANNTPIELDSSLALKAAD